MAKNNGFWLKVAGIALALALTGAAVVTGFVSDSHQIKDNRDNIKDHEERMRTVETAVIEQRTDTGYIKESLVRIEKKLNK
jgi:hypothetical protein